ncbi:MAG: hypothetical protein K9J19_04770 [Methylotenera sp.]|nr:hypothetical protein [Methylotenera sp.]
MSSFLRALGRRCVLLAAVCLPAMAWAQTPWPAMQVDMYPYVETMLQTRPEQTVLLGEGELQTGIFYASVAEAYSEEVQSALIADAEEKDWRLLSLVRLGTSYIMTLTKNNRILDLRLTNTERGVDVVYSVLMSQQPKRQ